MGYAGTDTLKHEPDLSSSKVQGYLIEQPINTKPKYQSLILEKSLLTARLSMPS